MLYLADSSLSVSEQTSVFKDLADWIRGTDILPTGCSITIADLEPRTNTVSITPLKGICKSKQFACGDYEAYIPFAIYYRTPADCNNATYNALDILNSIGDALGDNTTLKLSGGKELVNAVQELTAMKYKQTGVMCDFVANYSLTYFS